MTSDNRYGPDDSPDTDATAMETISAQDGEVEAEVIVRTTAPNIEAAGVLAEALASANRSVVDRVFSGEPPEGPAEAEEQDEEDEGRIMDLPEDVA